MLLDAGVKHVIAVNAADEVLDVAARVFCRALYSMLMSGRNVVDAFEIACNRVRQDDDLLRILSQKDWKPVSWTEALKFRLLPENSRIHNQPIAFEQIEGRIRIPRWKNTNLEVREEDPVIGRQLDLHQLARKLRQAIGGRCILLHGMGGMGKTVLARAAGRWQHERRRWRDGVWVVELRNVAYTAQARDLIASELRLPRLAAANNRRLSLALRRKDCLLILNDLDQLILNDSGEDLASLFDALLAGPWIRILATSRVDLPGAIRYHNFETQRLNLQGARTAFRQYAPPPEEWGDDESHFETLDGVLKFLDGYPFPIRLAAKYMVQRRCSLKELRNRLEASPVATLAYQNQPEDRDSSLSVTLQISFEALPVGAKELWPLLGLFPAGLDLNAANSIFGEQSTASLETMLAFSMAEHRELAGTRRFSLPEPARRYAESKLLPDAMDRYSPIALRWYCDNISDLAVRIHARQEVAFDEDRAIVSTEMPNIQMFIEWGYDNDIEASGVSLSARIVAGLAPFWSHVATGQLETADSELNRALAAAKRAGDHLATGRVLEGIAEIRAADGDLSSCLEYFRAAGAVYDQAKLEVDGAKCWAAAGRTLDRKPSRDESVPHYEEAARRFAELGMIAEEAVQRRAIGEIWDSANSLDLAIASFERASACYDILKDIDGLSRMRTRIAIIKSSRDESKARETGGGER